MTDACSAENKSTNQVAKPIANKILSIEYFYIPVHTGEINVLYGRIKDCHIDHILASALNRF